MADTRQQRIDADAMAALVRDIFAAAGTSRAEGERIGRYLVAANLTGHDSHGVIRVPRYVSWLAEGIVVADRTITLVIDTPVMAVVDGQFGFGQTVTPQAVELGIAKCKAAGLAAIALRNSGHLGRVGEWAEMAAAENLVSIHFVTASGSVLVAPFGGVERRFSTAPYCVGIPRAGHEPIVLDFATSLVAEGKVLVASQGGKELPSDALIGPDGRISADPELLYGAGDRRAVRDHSQGVGAIRAFGEHKGSGLALVCELIGGSLTGTGATAPDRRFANGMFSIYIDPERIDPEGFFPGDVARYAAFVESAKPIEPGGEVLLPGEPERRSRAERLAHGLPLARDTLESILRTAREVGLGDSAAANLLAGLR